ncbi:MAG: glutamate--tRNA ligase [Chthonomonadales bacterium]
MSVRVRYAPSPTGSPHIGNIRTAIFNWLFARHEGGVFIARLEDTDRSQERYKPESIAEIEASLNFLGVTPDEWWVNGDPNLYVQSNRLPMYQAAADKLIESGNAYPCFCTTERLTEMRAEQQARGVPSGYDKRCRRLSVDDRQKHIAAGTPFTVRLAVPMEGKTTYRDEVYGEITFENKLIDDQVLLKSTGWPTYHLAVVVDDHDLGITHVIRGEDWQPSTPKQVLLYQMLGYEMPKWIHCPLIVGIDKKKLSKRHGSTQFSQFIDEGYLPEALFNYLVLCGWSAGEENRELFSKEEIVARFTIEGISKSAAVFDYDKLRWMNGDYIRATPIEKLTTLCLPYFQSAGFVGADPSSAEMEFLAKVVPLVSERLKVLNEVAGFTDFFFHSPQEFEEKGRKKWLTGEDAQKRIQAAIDAICTKSEELTVEEAEAATNEAAVACESERGPVIHTLRTAVTGRTVGPGLFETLNVLGKTNVIERLKTALKAVEL